MAQLTFKADTHQYFIGKKQIPSVSAILKKVGLTKDFTGVDEFYRNRGIACHLAIKLYLEGILDKSSLDPAIKPHFEAFLKYSTDHPLGEILALEKPMNDLSESFAGTPDLVTDRAIYDWKCSKSHDKVAELQGQAYKVLGMHNKLMLETEVCYPFVVVELHDDGTFAEFEYGSGHEQWPSVMDLYRWRCGKTTE
jgi:hypothetical protein